MGRRYTATVFCSAITGAKELVQVASAANKAVAVRAVHIEQSNRAGDASAQMLRVQVYRAATSTGTSTTFTATPLDPADTAFAGTVKYADAQAKTLASTPGVMVTEGGMNNQAGWHWTPDDKGATLISGTTNFLVVNLSTAPAAATDFEVTLELEEIG
jgi:hypothetical protein